MFSFLLIGAERKLGQHNVATKVETMLSDIVFAMKIFARVARVTRVSDLAV